MKLRDLTRFHIKQFLVEKSQSGRLSKATVRLIRAVLSSMLAEAVDDGSMAANPAMMIRRNHGRKKPDGSGQQGINSERPFTEAEVSALLEAASDLQMRVLFLLLARAGLRPGEAIALQWADFNFTDRRILVERNFYDGVLGDTKTGVRRLVDMSQQLAAALSNLYMQREREKLSGKLVEIPQWVFCWYDGEPLRIEHVRSAFDRALKRAGLSGHVPYDLRHTFASTLLAKGVPLTYVARQLGHKKPTITLQYYAHWIPSGDKSFVDSPRLTQPTHRFGTTQPKAKYSQGNLAESNLNIC